MKTAILLATSILSTNLFAGESENTNRQLVPYMGKPGQYELSLNIPVDNLKNAMASRFPSLFTRQDSDCSGRLDLAQRLIKSLETSHPHLIQQEALPLIKHQRAELLKMVPAHPQLQFLVDEIDFDLKRGIVDLSKVYGYGFRILGAISQEPSKDALSIFSELNGDEIDQNLRTNWRSPASALFIAGNEKIYSSYTTHGISSSLHELLEKVADQKARPTTHYPIFGRGRLGLTTLIEAFINRQYPYPVQDKTLTAHGIEMTPFLFGYHDYLHGEGDSATKESSFYEAAHTKFNKLAQDKVDADQLIPALVDFMVGKGQLIEDSMTALLNLYITNYLPDRGMQALKKAMVGFFQIIHEDFDLSPDVYDTANFSDLIDLFISNSYSDADNDLLKTDPLTGKTSLTEEEMLDAIIDSRISPENQPSYIPYEPIAHSTLEGKKYRIKVQEDSMLTTITLKVQGGIEHIWEEKTLRYSLAEAQDRMGLLRIAGIKMTLPAISELESENGREIALNFLDQIEKNMDDCKQAFRTSALELVGLVKNGETKSLWGKFWNKSKKLERALTAAVALVE